MSISDDFVRDYRNELDDSAYPVWPLGTDIALGDWGRFEDGQFHKDGGIADYIPDPALRPVETTSKSGTDGFSHGVQTEIAGDLGTPDLPGASAKLEISFKGAGGTLFRLDGIVHESFASLSKLKAELSRFKIRRGTVFITRITRADSAVLLCSKSADWTLEASGDATLLTAGQLGKVGVSLSEKSGTGYQRVLPERGESYAVAIQLHRKKLFGDFGLQSAALSAEEIEQEFEPFDPLSR